MKKIKLKAHVFILWILSGVMLMLGQAYADQPIQKISKPMFTGAVSIPLGQYLTETQFRAITRPFLKQAQQPYVYENDFCVGIIDDEEQAKGYGVLNFRQYKSQYAVDLVVFDGVMKNQSVLVGKKRFDQFSTLADVKNMDAELNENDDNGVVENRVTLKKYPVTQTLTLRLYDSDDLIYFYFNQNKIVSIQYVVQC